MRQAAQITFPRKLGRAVPDEYLATGFTDVDGRGDTGAYTRCLALLDSLPYYRQCKARSCELLDLSPGQSVLDVGCGTGDDVSRMAARVAPGGIAVGADPSAKLLAEAVRRTPPGARAAFIRADARALPFRKGSFARCRIERTLQHIVDPKSAIREMARVLAPGGLLLSYDNDWRTFSVEGGDAGTAGIIAGLWADSFTNPTIGARLEDYFREAGLRIATVEPSTPIFIDFETADRVFNLRQTAARAVGKGLLAPSAADEWLVVAQARSRAGDFRCSLTACTVVGMK